MTPQEARGGAGLGVGSVQLECRGHRMADRGSPPIQAGATVRLSDVTHAPAHCARHRHAI